MFNVFDYSPVPERIFNEERNLENFIMKFPNKLQRGQARNSSFERNLYFKEMKPIFMVLRVLGRFPYGFTKTGFAPFSVFSWPFLYSIFFNILLYWVTTWSMRTIIRDKLWSSESYDETLYWILMLLFALQTFTAPVTYWWDAHKTIRYFRMWKEFEEFWKGEPVITAQRCKIAKITAFLVIPYITVFVFLEEFLLVDMSLLVFVPYVPILAAAVVMLEYWCLTLYELRQCSDKLLKGIIKDSTKSEIGYERRVWVKTSKLVSELGHATALSGLCFLVSTFVDFVLSAYGTLFSITVSSTASSSFWGLFLSVLFCGSYNYVAFDAAHRATEQIGPIFSHNLLQMDVSPLKENTLNQIDLLMKSIAAKSPVIEFLGFVEISRHTFGYFITSTVTYLIVLLQFKTDPKKQLEAITTEYIINNTTSYTTLWIN